MVSPSSTEITGLVKPAKADEARGATMLAPVTNVPICCLRILNPTLILMLVVCDVPIFDI
jgi:hypothetical protein